MCIKEFKTARVKAMNKVGESDFRAIGFCGKHAFPEEGSTHCDAVNAAEHLATAPNFKRVCEAEVVQLIVKIKDFGIYPSFAAVSTISHGSGKIRI